MRRFLMLWLACCAVAVSHSLVITPAVAQPTMGISPGAQTQSAPVLVGNTQKGCWWAHGNCLDSCANMGGSTKHCNSVCSRSLQKCKANAYQPLDYPKR
jgi:hypothetical protein